jgi:2-polyprenyl-3-methyl-5-hydroxy-6-metoxy-1,4-benzoquinol methylase
MPVVNPGLSLLTDCDRDGVSLSMFGGNAAGGLTHNISSFQLESGVSSQWQEFADTTEQGVSGSLLWRCLACQGRLQARSGESVQCQDCDAHYPAVDGIPDLRSREGSAARYEQEDFEAARQCSEDLRDASVETVMAQLSDRQAVDDAIQGMRVKQILSAPPKFHNQFEGWLKPCVIPEGVLLDVGCGSGGLLAAAATMGIWAAGIDASMTNLVAAKHMIEAHGGTARLACAYAEALPIAGASVNTVTMYDSIEHVSSVRSTISEACRILKPGGSLAISTPNRFSLTREPHVLIWGVGWLPRALQGYYVRWRTGQPYDHTRLMSTWEMARELRHHHAIQFEFGIPPVPEEEIANFSPRRAFLANLYNRISGWKILRPVMLAIGPFYQVTARRLS